MMLPTSSQHRPDLSKSRSDLDMIKQVQKAKLDEIKKLCRGMKDICSSFNLTDELSTVVASLKAEAKRLTSSKARADADATIVDLLAFIDKLSRGSPASSQRGSKYDYGQITIEELDLEDELADIDLEDDHDGGAPNREHRAARPVKAMQGNSGASRWSTQVHRQDGYAVKAVCRNFASGHCNFGDRCHFRHVATSAMEWRPLAQCHSSPSNSRPLRPSVSRPGSASRGNGNGAMGQGSISPAYVPPHSRPGSDGQQGPRLPTVQQQKMVATHTVPANKSGMIAKLMGPQGTIVVLLCVILLCIILYSYIGNITRSTGCVIEVPKNHKEGGPVVLSVFADNGIADGLCPG